MKHLGVSNPSATTLEFFTDTRRDRAAGVAGHNSSVRDQSLMKPHRLSFDGGLLEDAQEAVGGEGNVLGLGDGVVYRGWMNELRGRYSPATYHVNQAQSVLVRLESSTLRISRPAKAVLKHAFHEDPTLTQPQPTMVSQTIYSLVNAHVSLRPKRLPRRRWWVRKYPVYTRFFRKAGNIVNVSKPLLRSASMHSVGTAPECFPSVYFMMYFTS
ncbi:hypothetical protein KIN20_032517 [Parelaphostrongylus tenuis]|uniref:Uncharacterized protein n=1 Tax=Parelaphostrongylus tenuis TaxID=148309 RepID=A0AAD5R8Y4_PARTN|nr:hypothetical protein KIN20_032517 [Parelaphostrongylus tenuis]